MANTLTKSLHTVTAVTNVAAHLLACEPRPSKTPARILTARALEVLGYDVAQFAADDDTVQRCLASVKKLTERA